MKYMMATKAYHTMGNISSDEPDICLIVSEDQDNYIGNWVEGFGFTNVKFPKETTRELTDIEKNHYNGMLTEHSNGVVVPICIEDAPNNKPVSKGPIVVKTRNGSVYRLGPVLEEKENYWVQKREIYHNSRFNGEEGMVGNLIVGKSMVILHHGTRRLVSSPIEEILE